MKKTTTVKSVSVLLAASLFLALTGCGKPTTEKLEKYVTDELDAEVIEIESMKDLEEMKDSLEDEELLEDGILIKFSGEALSEICEEGTKELKDEDSETYDMLENYFGTIYPDGKEFDEVVDSLSLFIKGEGNEDELTVTVCAMIDYIEKDDAKRAFDTIAEDIDGIGWIFKKMGGGFSTDDFNKQEFSHGKNSGYLIINLDYERYSEALMSVLEECDLSKSTIKQIEKTLEIFEDYKMAFEIYYEGDTLTILIGISADGTTEDTSALAKEIGLKDPFDVENSDELINGIMGCGRTLAPLFSTSLNNYLDKAKDAATRIDTLGNEDVDYTYYGF